MKDNNGYSDHTYIGLQISLHTWLWTKRPTCQLLTAKKLLYCICYTIWIDWHMIFALEPESGSLIAPMALAHPLHPTVNRSRNRRRNLWVGWCVSSWWPLFPSRSSVSIYIYIYMQVLYWFTNCVLLSDDNSLIPGCLWLLEFVLNNTLILVILVFYNRSPPRMFLSLDLLSEYRIQHGAIGPLYVTSSYSTWIFCRGVSGFATDCPCDVWCRGLTICLLHVDPPFGNRFLNNNWAVGLT